jgi:hypothetical protein
MGDGFQMRGFASGAAAFVGHGRLERCGAYGVEEVA